MVLLSNQGRKRTGERMVGPWWTVSAVLDRTRFWWSKNEGSGGRTWRLSPCQSYRNSGSQDAESQLRSQQPESRDSRVCLGQGGSQVVRSVWSTGPGKKEGEFGGTGHRTSHDQRDM